MLDFPNMTLEQKFEAATRDDILSQIVPSDIRGMLRQIEDLETALVFCSGSADFGADGQAHQGWMRLCEPLLANKRPENNGEE